MDTKKWTLDSAHSNIQFKAKHLMITTITGNFSAVTGSVETEGDDFTTGKFNFTAEVNSISTGNTDRDIHLKSDDFFNEESFHQITFIGSEVSNIDGDEFELHGDMTIRDVSMSVVLNIEIGGVAVDPWGKTKAGFSFKSKLNRKDFGLKFHVISETGNLLVSDQIKLEGEVQLAAEEAVKV
jgi:polyisoprenoid-binding protein YceI